MPIVRRPLIAHVIYRLDTGGLENGLVNIINRLTFDCFDHVIVCLTDYTDFRERLRPGVEVVALHKKPGHDLGLYWRLFQTFRRLQPDIVHTRNLAALEAQLPAWLAGVSYRIHGLHGWDISNMSGENSKYRRLHRLIDPLVHRYIPLSADLERYLTEAVRVNSNKITRICNGVDTEKFMPPGNSGKIRLPEPLRNKMIIGTVGRMEVVKDQLNLVTAYLRLLERDPALKDSTALVLVGDGTQRGYLENLLAETKFKDNVWFAGNRTDVPDILAAMDLFVLPSKAEGISNTLLEAMATGLAVVATDVGGNAELVAPGSTGMLVPKEDSTALAQALFDYVSQPERLRAHGKAARGRAVESFSLDKMVSEYQKVYQKQ